MLTILLVCLVAFVVTAVLTPLVRRLAIFSDFVDAPSERKIHATPVPLLGGMAIVGGAAVGVLLIIGEVDFSERVKGVLLALTLIFALGLIDDRIGLSAWAKLLVQVAAIAVLIYFDVSVQLAIPGALNIFLTFVWILAVCNATNFLDNMDGLCVGVSAVASATIALIAALNGQLLVAVLASSILGACLGFLRHNFTPARIFMGDAGSLFLGFSLAIAALLLRFPGEIRSVSWSIPIILMGVPLFDLLLVVISRVRRGLNPLTTAGKDHMSHRLVAMGLSQRKAVLLIYVAGIVCGVLATAVARADVALGFAVCAFALVAAAIGLWRLEWRFNAAGLT